MKIKLFMTLIISGCLAATYAYAVSATEETSNDESAIPHTQQVFADNSQTDSTQAIPQSDNAASQPDQFSSESGSTPKNPGEDGSVGNSNAVNGERKSATNPMTNEQAGSNNDQSAEDHGGISQDKPVGEDDY